MMKNNANEYGLALFKLACESGSQDRIFNDFKAVNTALNADPELVRLLSNPRVTASERVDIIDKIFSAETNVYLVSMMKILAEKRIFHILPKCWEEYRKLYCDANNILSVTATTAVELSDDQKARLVDTLTEKTGSKILLETKVDKSCLGGICLEYGGKRYDASVKTRLNSLKKSLTGY